MVTSIILTSLIQGLHHLVNDFHFFTMVKVFWTATSKNLFFVKNVPIQRLNLPSERMESLKPAKLVVIKVFLFGSDCFYLSNRR